jgi:hypothetical protein
VVTKKMRQLKYADLLISSWTGQHSERVSQSTIKKHRQICTACIMQLEIDLVAN